MNKLFWFSALFFALMLSAVAQTAAKKEFLSPLECSLFLAKNEPNEFEKTERLRQIAFYQRKLGRKEDALKTIELIPDRSVKTRERIDLARELVMIGKITVARPLLLKTLSDFEIESNWNGEDKNLRFVLDSLIRLGKPAETISFVEVIEDVEDKTAALILLAELFGEKGQTEKSSVLLAQAQNTIARSKWADLRLFTQLKIGNAYAKIGEREKASELIEKAAAGYQSVEYQNTRKDYFEEKIIEAYGNLKEFDKALKFFAGAANLDDQGDLFKLAELNRNAGNRAKSDALLLQIERMQQSSDPDDYIWSKIIEKPFDENDYGKVTVAAAKLKSEFYQFQVVDRLIERNQTDSTGLLLNLILTNAEKIVPNEFESVLSSTSPQLRKAQILNETSERYAKIEQFEKALKIIETIEKPYLKAKSLTFLATRQNDKNAVELLNRARTLIESPNEEMLDAHKFTVRNEIALGFAQIERRETAAEIFAGILADEEINDDSFGYLILTSYYFEKSGLKSDEKIVTLLKSIIENWEAENL